jgi:hypothetical protein
MCERPSGWGDEEERVGSSRVVRGEGTDLEAVVSVRSRTAGTTALEGEEGTLR